MKESKKIFLTKEEVEIEIRNYLGNADYDLYVELRGQHPVVELSYTDFKPARQVRMELEKSIRNIEFTKLERDYSKQAISLAAQELVCDPDEKYFVVVPGTDKFQQMSMFSIIDSQLYCREIS